MLGLYSFLQEMRRRRLPEGRSRTRPAGRKFMLPAFARSGGCRKAAAVCAGLAAAAIAFTSSGSDGGQCAAEASVVIRTPDEIRTVTKADIRMEPTNFMGMGRTEFSGTPAREAGDKRDTAGYSESERINTDLADNNGGETEAYSRVDVRGRWPAADELTGVSEGDEPARRSEAGGNTSEDAAAGECTGGEEPAGKSEAGGNMSEETAAGERTGGEEPAGKSEAGGNMSEETAAGERTGGVGPAGNDEAGWSTRENAEGAELNGEKVSAGAETAVQAGNDGTESVSEDAVRAAACPADAVVACTREDYQVLLRIVEAEAGICDEEGRILVANVILNRVRSSAFPNTITEVVYQKSQFSPVSSGSIDACVVTQETIDCVNRALKGEDYSQGALFFMNRQGASARSVSWFDSHLTYLFSHEGHEFFR